MYTLCFKIYRNIKEHPQEDKFKRLRKVRDPFFFVVGLGMFVLFNASCVKVTYKPYELGRNFNHGSCFLEAMMKVWLHKDCFVSVIK